MSVYGYLRASTKEQDAMRAEDVLKAFAASHGLTINAPLFVENESGSKLERPELFKLLSIAESGDILLIESIDRLSRLNESDWNKLSVIIKSKGIKIVAVDFPDTHACLSEAGNSWLANIVSEMLLNMYAYMARKDYEMRRERCKQGIERAKAKGVVLGRKRDDSIDREAIIDDLEAGMSYRAVAAKHSISLGTVQRIKKELSEA